jgi:hypothetical protein
MKLDARRVTSRRLEGHGYRGFIQMQTTLPNLQVRQSDTDSGENWSVRATWEDGTFEEISGFQNEVEANEWITNKFQIWLTEVTKARAS